MRSARKHGFQLVRPVSLSVYMLLFVLLANAHAKDSVKEGVEGYFTELRESFTEIASSPAVRKTRLSYTDRFFVRSLKKHQVIYSLLRTNSKGLVISEIIRGETPERNYRSIANQQWFQYIARNNKEYHGFLKEDGRYYLFWAEPVILTTRSGKKKFGGAVAAKVDIWDSFHKFSSTIEQPFLIRLNGKSLYSHKWQEDYAYIEENLDILGVDRITVRLEEMPQTQEPDSAMLAMQQAKARAVAEQAAIEAKKPPVSLKMESYTPVIIVGVVLLLIMIVALIRVVMWVRYRRLISRIDKEDIL